MPLRCDPENIDLRHCRFSGIWRGVGIASVAKFSLEWSHIASANSFRNKIVVICFVRFILPKKNALTRKLFIVLLVMDTVNPSCRINGIAKDSRILNQTVCLNLFPTSRCKKILGIQNFALQRHEKFSYIGQRFFLLPTVKRTGKRFGKGTSRLQIWFLFLRKNS